MKFRLLFSLTSDFIFLSVLEVDKVLVNIQKYNFRQHSENFFTHLKEGLNEAQISLAEIKEIYFTDSPGSQTGIRIGLAFILTLQTINPEIKIFHLNSLMLQSGGEGRTINLISIDLKKTKYHCAVYQGIKCLFGPEVIEMEKLNEIKKTYSEFAVKEDFKKIKFLSNFRQLLPYFKPFKISEIKI
jgi:tRNA A37 threonylcarbamoyladenosine modification protein TsaB